MFVTDPDHFEPADHLDQTGPADGVTSRRHLLRFGVGAAAGAAALGGLLASPAGATSTPTPSIKIGRTNSGTGPTTSLSDSPFRAALEDWGGQVYNVRAYGAAGNGTTDDTTAIRAAQSAAGAGCVYFPAGTYLTSGLKIDAPGQTFKIESGATIKATATIVKPVITVAAVGVTILGPGTVDGNATGRSGILTGYDGIKFNVGGDDGRVEGVVVQHVAWIGIEGSQVNRTKITHNRVLTCGHAGITVSAVSASIDGPLILGNIVRLTGPSVATGIDVNGASPTVIVNFPTVMANDVGVVTAGLCYQLSNCWYGRVVGNRGEGPQQVFSLGGGTDNVVSANTAWATGAGAGIEFGCNNSTCTGNTVYQSGTGAGIHVDNGAGTHVTIAGNKVVGAHTCGIGVGSYHHVTITGNVVVQSTAASDTFACIQVEPTGPGLVTIGDNVCDGGGASGFGIWLNNLVSAAVQVTVHDNAITGIETGSSFAAIRLSGAGTVTDLLVHDNTVGSGIPLYTVAPGISFGNNVRFHDNIVIGQSVPGLSRFTLPASGTAYVNTGPFREIIYLLGGKLKTSGSNQGVMKNGKVLVPSSVDLKTPVSIELEPGESLTVYYSTAPTAHRDVKS
jgi:hypothetical protein